MWNRRSVKKNAAKQASLKGLDSSIDAGEEASAEKLNPMESTEEFSLSPEDEPVPAEKDEPAPAEKDDNESKPQTGPKIALSIATDLAQQIRANPDRFIELFGQYRNEYVDNDDILAAGSVQNQLFTMLIDVQELESLLMDWFTLIPTGQKHDVLDLLVSKDVPITPCLAMMMAKKMPCEDEYYYYDY